MVKPFSLARSPKIIFGHGKISELPGLAKSYGNDVLVVTGANSLVNSKHGEFLTNTFDITGVHYHLVPINREPSPEMIDMAVIRYRDANIRLVVAIGGGSVIDAGKAISAMLYRTESVRDFLEGVGTKEHPGTKVPFIAIPTTSGTGSEATANAVISQIGVAGFKKSLRHENFVPDVAIVDPELTLNCPRDITANSGMDCFTQLVEAYLSTKAFSYTDSLALDGIRSLIGALPRVWKWGQDSEARAGMSYAALISGICLTNAGLGVVHGFASSVGGLFNVPHGAVCGTLMAPANAITVKKLRQQDNSAPALLKYATLGRFFADENQKSQDYYVDLFISKLFEWSNMLNLPSLEKYGIKTSDFVKIATLTENKNNPVKLEKDELVAILEMKR
jgi:alcohol dehydrogenase class IV